VSTLAGALYINISDLTAIEVNLGVPNFEPHLIPIVKDLLEALPLKGRYRLQVQHSERDVSLLSLGNPHCVFTVPSTQEAAVQEIGEALQEHPAFPKGLNVTFMQVLARNHVRCRVYERGAGETLACGSGACAAVITGILQKELNPEVKVDMLGGALTVRWDGQNSVYLKGPVVRVFHGEFCVTQRESLF
jgi:diaminopimelate epimerase